MRIDSTETSELLYYQITVSNSGALVSPVILEFVYADKTTSRIYIPAEIWRYNAKKIRKLIASEKEIEGIIIDPDAQLGDINLSNNYWQGRLKPQTVEVIK